MEPAGWWSSHARFIQVYEDGTLTFKFPLRDSTKEEEQKYKAFVDKATRLPGEEIIALAGGNTEKIYNLNGWDIQTILLDGQNENGKKTGGWLNDKCINGYMDLLQQRVKNAGTKVWFFNSFFYNKLKKEGHQGVARWTLKKNVDIFAMDKIIFPIHLGAHWTLGIINMRDRRLEYYDSLGGRNEEYLNLMWQYLQEEAIDKGKEETFDTNNWNAAKVNGDTLPQQKNGWDCGVFMCQFAECFSRDVWPTFTSADIPVFRRRMVVELATGKLLQDIDTQPVLLEAHLLSSSVLPPIVIVAPHACLHRKPPHCDTNSVEFARMLYDALKGKNRTAIVELYESETYRHLCDPNRATCRNAPLRKALRRFMLQYPNAYILEVHSFPKETLEKDWKTLPLDTQSVVLSVHDLDWFERRVIEATGSAVLPGSKTVNDISKEAIKNGWTHVLFEIRYDADLEKMRDKMLTVFLN